ncbi:MAG: replication-relaxation family protein [Deltaproteobacteria bacterium]|nr:replication-relaxation family protein [Deltaproteobacteria bacterium]
MALKLTKGDKEILTLIGLYRMLTVSQIAALARRSRQVIRRRLRYLSGEGLIVNRIRGFGRSSGRPEEIILLTGKSSGILQNEGLHTESVPLISPENIDAIAVDHDLLINWFYIHLIQIEKSIPELTINTHAPWFGANKEGKHALFDPRIRVKSDEHLTEFIPDGIFTIRHKGLRKSLLFFLEVDMDTEPIASLDRSPNDIRQKVINYQAIFRNGNYKRFENIFGFKFNGFRLLFMTNSPTRSTSLSRLVREMPPSDFIWLTNQGEMFSHGLASEIWVRGGKIDQPAQSIIGSNLAAKTSVIESIK